MLLWGWAFSVGNPSQKVFQAQLDALPSTIKVFYNSDNLMEAYIEVENEV
ncbi:MAG: hypothetical protein ACUVRD_08710 [Bacteroidia bacterium]